MSIKAVIFDMGGVLIEAPYGMWRGPTKPLFRCIEKKLEFDRGSLMRALLTPPVRDHFEALERGETTAEDFDPLFTQYYNKKYGRSEEHIPMFSTIIKGLYNTKIIPEMAALLKDLRSAGCKTALLTNNFYADRARLIPTIPKGIENYFDVVVESCRAGMRKPEDAIYLHVCSQLKLKPEQCMFLDDLGINLRAARALGITTIKVTSPPEAAEEVRNALRGLFKLPQ